MICDYRYILCALTFLLLPTWYTNFLFIHINYIKSNSSTCFERNPLIIRRSTTQIVILWCTANQISRLCALVGVFGWSF